MKPLFVERAQSATRCHRQQLAIGESGGEQSIPGVERQVVQHALDVGQHLQVARRSIHPDDPSLGEVDDMEGTRGVECHRTRDPEPGRHNLRRGDRGINIDPGDGTAEEQRPIQQAIGAEVHAVETHQIRDDDARRRDKRRIQLIQAIPEEVAGNEQPTILRQLNRIDALTDELRAVRTVRPQQTHVAGEQLGPVDRPVWCDHDIVGAVNPPVQARCGPGSHRFAGRAP